MPELPEVEVTRRGLLPHVRGRRVLAVGGSGLALRRPVPLEDMAALLPGRKTVTVDRRAKYLLLRFSGGAVLLLHLGMSGRLVLAEAGEDRQRHDHVWLELEGGVELRLNDPRRFGLALPWPPGEAADAEAELTLRCGIEPLDPDFNGPALARLARGRRVAVKQMLMNSRLVAGMGNIYTCEALFAARIHPARPAGGLGEAEWERLARCCRQAIEAGIAAGGTTIADFRGVDGQSGWFQLQLAVYGRAGQPCPACGAPVRREPLGGRSTFFCPVCQE